MGRLEKKYLILNQDLDMFRDYFNTYLEVDPYALKYPNNQYTVRSIYFDTNRLDSYHEKLAGIKVRKKIRIRGYELPDNEDIIFLEVKRKNVNFVSKNRSPLKYKNLVPLLASGMIEKYIYKNNDRNNSLSDANTFLYHIYTRHMRPVIKVIYDREPFFYKFDSTLRITFDKNIRSSRHTAVDSLAVERNSVFTLPNHFILEIKSCKPYPEWLRYLLASYEIKHQALSKYTMCIDSIRRSGGYIKKHKLPYSSRSSEHEPVHWKEVVL